jgi:hypothetical protein
MGGYDIIGDVHGCALQLINLLDGLGYRNDRRAGAYLHRSRQAIFVGDLIDRGPDQLKVLETVRRMADVGSAQIVMGNHEFNAIAYDTRRPGSGAFLRPHSEDNRRQHREFLTQVTGATRAAYIEWFKSLPLWLDLGDFRVVHACWHDDSVRTIEEALGGNRFGPVDQFVEAATEGTPLYDAIEVTLKGPEIDLTKHGLPPYLDKDGGRRAHARVAWWNGSAMTLRDLAVLDGNFTTGDGDSYPALPEIEVDADMRSFRYEGDVPVFYGHYWRRGDPRRGLECTARTACVDFSAVKGGDLVAYRWNGESQIRAENYYIAS